MHLYNNNGEAENDFKFIRVCNTLYMLSPRLCFIVVLKRDLCVYRDDSLTS